MSRRKARRNPGLDALEGRIDPHALSLKDVPEMLVSTYRHIEEGPSEPEQVCIPTNKSGTSLADLLTPETPAPSLCTSCGQQLDPSSTADGFTTCPTCPTEGVAS